MFNIRLLSFLSFFFFLSADIGFNTSEEMQKFQKFNVTRVIRSWGCRTMGHSRAVHTSSYGCVLTYCMFISRYPYILDLCRMMF